MSGYGEFELDIEAAFRQFLPPFIDTIQDVTLSTVNLEGIPDRKNGIYLLFQNGHVRYVGKTDAQAGFRQRLERHMHHLQHRYNLNPQDISFKAIAIPVFKNADIENMLIRYYTASWNNSGFGSNDPGKNRDGQKPAKFDREYPINVDIPLEFLPEGRITCREILLILRSNLHYVFRYETAERQEDLDASIDVHNGQTLREVLENVILVLRPNVWQATILHGRVILYPNHTEMQYNQALIR